MAQENKKPIHAKPSIYAYYFHAIKEIGITYGYNIVLHGSLNRDLDLIAIAWQKQLGNVDDMIEKIAKLIGGEIMMQCRSVNNIDGVRFQTTHHGRKQYVININRDMNYRFNGTDSVLTEYPDPQYYIDISVISPVTELQQHIKERTKIWEWLCRGYGIHGLHFRDFKNLTKEWLIENYNLSEEYFL